MNKITRHNYEAFFLDFLEGTLSEDDKVQLEIFLNQNPDLAAELEEFESFSIKPETEHASWDSLKVPSLQDLKKSKNLRDQLYFRCTEGDANNYDNELLTELISGDPFKNEYVLWQKLKLSSTAESIDREGLYQLPLSLPITPFNYDNFLVARTEGILSDEENHALEIYASGIESGEKDLSVADALKLDAPKGIFYPFKNELKKKKKGLVLFYRAAAIILLLGLSASLFILINQDGNSDPRYAQRDEVQISTDTSKTMESKDEMPEDTILNEDEIKVERLQLEEWEMREPDPVFVADNKEPKNMEPLSEQEEKEISRQFDNEDFDEMEFAEVEPVEVLEKNQQTTIPEIREENEMILAEEIPVRATQKFKTITEIAEERVADQFNLSDEERDEMALSVAKRITQKAGETLDSELKKEVDEDSDRLTYSLRIGGFKVSHSTAK